MDKTINELTKEVINIYSKYEKTGTKKWDYEIASKDLSYQVGSLMKRIMQLKNERYGEGLSETQIKEKIGDELVDILAEVLFISSELHINLEDAFNRMIDSDKNKINSRV